ncbi:MAG: hypothetical protein ACTIIH_10305 [Brevibacterium sp.]|uniref:hypothetical protein n=1 Tax=Brevibacterium sp. TaxID=1701 RepID=UPI003F8F9B9D
MAASLGYRGTTLLFQRLALLRVQVLLGVLGDSLGRDVSLGLQGITQVAQSVDFDLHSRSH